MATDDFPTSPAKRQRTDSPETNRDLPSIPGLHPLENTPDGVQHETLQNSITGPMDIEVGEDIETSVTASAVPEQEMVQQAPSQDSNSLLDALMLQVEAQSSSIPKIAPSSPITVVDAAQEAEAVESESMVIEKDGAPETHADADNGTQQSSTNQPAPATSDAMDVTHNVVDEQIENHVQLQDAEADTVTDTNSSIPIVGNTAGAPAVPALPEAHIAAIDSIPATEPHAPDQDAEGVEWEIDSSPYESSDSDSSDDTSSDEDSDEDADGEYSMLDPEETARILMQGDGGSDDEGGKSRDKAEGAALRTANERTEEVIPKPEVIVTEDMKIEELGNVEFVVENNVVIKAKTSGEYQVLESGSLICLKDRSVVGVIADLIGRVEEPRYTIRFTNDEAIAEAGLSAPGTTVFYVPTYSTFVFTQPLKAVKGSDASNFHDEEVGDDEMEFSDDEAEAEHKRQMKARRQGRLVDTGRGRGRGGPQSGRGSHRGGRRPSHSRNNDNNGLANGNGAYGDGSLEMNYDDVPNGADDGYTPLQRPDSFAGNTEQHRGDTAGHPLPPPPSSFRGDRGGFRSRGGGGFNQPRGPFNNQHNANNTQNGSHSYPRAPEVTVPMTPSITPHNAAYTPMTPSPMSPLPNVPYNFGGYQPPAGFPYMPQSMPGLQPPSFPYQQQQHQHQHQQQQQYHQPYQATQYNAPGMQPYQTSQSYAPGTQPAAQPSFPSGPWANNPALAAALQRQVEEQRRNQGM
ncbi:Gar1/Naf1 RNA binding region-domain-containing protein [Exophiala viscosa]|uniref:H/ACA ribonucleoprotein complex non-core subunit NAF1 n=1 Tax=Exophiala viscosa TaxID=2486360 RepID=A0AAN6E2Y1_9EURO|nr:Gar1/Naf1 RNA binding region-domain-containing protein [Exophiala viscosa]